MEVQKPKVGLALSAGAIRGMAHLGVLQVFEEEHIPIDLIAGTSAGALVGGLYAMGVELKYLRQLACSIRWEHISELTIPRRGLVAGKRYLDFLRVLTQNKNIEDAKIPFATVATDIKTGEPVLFTEGSLAEAIRASTSIPGIFAPFYKEGRHLVDGALVDRIPIHVARELGADVVIAVDIGFGIGNSKVGNIFEILIQASDILMREISRQHWTQADLLIQPDVGCYPAMDLTRSGEIIQAGVEAAKIMIPEIKKLTGVG